MTLTLMKVSALKVSKYEVIPGPYSLGFGLNTDRIQKKTDQK